jgi:outer membrane protein
MPRLLPVLLLLAPVAAQGQTDSRLTLGEAVRMALETSPALAGVRSTRDGAEADRRSARASWFPSLMADGSVFRHEEPMLVAPIHGFTPGLVPDFDRTLYQGSVALGYTLFDGGARSAGTGRTRAMASVADAQVEGTEQAVIASTVRTYLEVLSTRGALDAEQRRLGALEAEGTRVRRLFEEGRAARVELLRADAALAQARAQHVTARTRLAVAEADLARLLGVDPERTRAGALVDVVLAADGARARDSVLRGALEASPTIRSATSRVSAAEASLRAAGAGWWPVLRVEGRIVNYGAANAPSTAEWQTGLRLSYPLFTGGARGAGTDRARAALHEAEAGRRDAERIVAARVDHALAAATEATERLSALAVAVRHLEEVVRVEALAREQGAGTQTDYLRAEAELADAQAALIRARHAVVVAHVDLAHAGGALTPSRLLTLVRTEP